MMNEPFWWQFTSDYWELPFYSEYGLTELPERDDALAAREQLWAMRECDEESGEETPETKDFTHKIKIEGESNERVD